MGTSMQTARILTDAGRAYIKTMGDHESPQLLAIELISTRLAQWFKLPVLDFAIIEIDSEIDEIPLKDGGLAISGPAFVTRAIESHTWGGHADELATLVNPQDVGRLVVFDTWLRNCDRYSKSMNSVRKNYDNVLLEHLMEPESGNLRLIAMDHTHCFTCGRELNDKLHHIDTVRDENVFGLFPGFVPFVRQDDLKDALTDLKNLDREYVREVINEVPDEWQITSQTKRSLAHFIIDRADFVSGNGLRVIGSDCWPGTLFDV